MPIRPQGALAQGFVSPGFEPVREAFELNFERYGEVGACCAVRVDGEPVVDLWGGDAGDGRPWTRDTIGLAYSVTKGATAILCCLLADRGELDLDAPVAGYWPEFGSGGKAATTVRMLLSHRAGLPALDGRLTFDEVLQYGTAARALAGQRPLWAPGTAFGYHALTYGWLLDEVVRRATGRTIQDLFAAEIAGPLGLDFFIGLPRREEHRVAALIGEPPEQDPSSLLTRAMTANGVFRTPDAATWNDPRIRRASIPAANGITNARSLARLYAALVVEPGRPPLLSGKTLIAAISERSAGRDLVTGLDSRFGTGFMLPTAGTPMLSGSSFGHEGVGGALGFADLDQRVGFGYVQNSLRSDPTGGPDPRVAGLISALRDSLGERRTS
ncbi:serine hydrolase domain-containing protein [Actinacidiphila oryziradicis]|uniref:Beta-lactamase family protein n=1 Tax=Actinacidiphila oryziradicis TaxID=2571141 RepID=A0A4U0S6B9_9ACTN|nr:serine hydrolase domain-containing protein [Actinacidiphila oryziradicis]TKA04626.1 beta-lactamase family protein [Actinacidiphila oryziradicis]